MVTCGIQEIMSSPTFERIYGGIEAVPHFWPWVRNNPLVFFERRPKYTFEIIINSCDICHLQVQ